MIFKKTIVLNLPYEEVKKREDEIVRFIQGTIDRTIQELYHEGSKIALPDRRKCEELSGGWGEVIGASDDSASTDRKSVV